MKKKNKIATTIVTAAGALSAAAQEQAPARKRPEQLISGLGSTNEVTSAAAYESAPEYGASAVRPLGFTMASRDLEQGRRCKRALLKIVHHAGRPSAASEAAAVETKLMPLLTKNQLPVQVRRELLWMLTEIGGTRSVEAIAPLLTDKDLREDARCALIRLPYPTALAALKTAFTNAPEDFKPALADALRVRGEAVDGCPSRKLTPVAQTSVQALKEKR